MVSPIRRIGREHQVPSQMNLKTTDLNRTAIEITEQGKAYAEVAKSFRGTPELHQKLQSALSKGISEEMLTSIGKSQQPRVIEKFLRKVENEVGRIDKNKADLMLRDAQNEVENEKRIERLAEPGKGNLVDRVVGFFKGMFE